MGGGAVKTIVLVMVLGVLSVLVGAQVSDNLSDSWGAFAVVFAAVLGFALLLLGKNSWYLVLIVPYALVNVQIPYVDSAMAVFIVSGSLFIYHIVQCKVMGFDRLKWHSLPFLDILIVLVAFYMCVSYYRYPVSINALGVDLEYVGGSTYVYAIGGVIYFVFISLLDVRRSSVEKIMRWAFFVQVAMLLLNIALRLKSGNIYWDAGEGAGVDGMEAAAGERRITVFVAISVLLLVFVYASRPLGALLRSPGAMLMIVAALVGGALSGARGFFVKSVVICAGISVAKREILVLVMIGVAVWGGLVGLGRANAFVSLPRTFQRTIAIVPGVKVSHKISRDTKNSSDVRLIAWKQAFEPSNGYIRDYIWGDGYQLSVKALGRQAIAAKRGTLIGIGLNTDTLARTGNWHNGFIYTMHRLGLVGCFLFYLVMFVEVTLFFRVGSYYRGRPFFPYYCVYGYMCFVSICTYSYSASTPIDFFCNFIPLASVKLLYCLLREEGALAPMSLWRQHYVPLVIRDLEQKEGVTLER